ncbi:tetratricopeptide repeat protein [Paenibacillus sp. HWE-109]|uniref:tetratricopeptide repeat protein n=1 Tax=Paenibacillus sp. HWE-109 TaxID=1306526 RepID=UPI001EDFA283|nr:tetratricopeptide repeat protein [Paenibacillus sp. HWE-109]UKS27296.1 tetratricopeptide repeat protein [Paenibacillus sp. HWE-109]
MRWKKNSNYVIETPIEVDSVPRIQEFVGREEEISILQRRKLSAIAITGVGGQGKTGLASELLKRYTRVENPTYDYGVWVDCRELPDSLHFKLIETLDRLTRGVESIALYRDEKMEDTVKRFIKHLTSNKILIVFDNIDAYVKADTEGPVEELKPLFEALCNNAHSSLAIFTCRPPLIHSSGSFHHFQLSGLTKYDAVDFFRKRGVQLSGDNAEHYCVEIVSLTKGHPWWLGLIAGQVNTKQDSLKRCVNKFSVGGVTSIGPIYEYFKDIWSQLNKERQNILRYLVEAHRPLTEDEIGIVVHDNGPDKLKKELRRLSRLGLVEPHESISTDGQFITYQVHPLIREFVHESYSTSAQERCVQRVLYVFLPKRVIDFLFKTDIEVDDSIVMSPAALMDSIETCLSSRNAEKALNLLAKYNELLYNSGYHHKYQSLACRVLDSIHWESHGLITKHSEFLESIITHLCYKGEQYRSNYYLKKYESLVESGTLAYLNYLKLACGVAWNEGRNNECITICESHVELSTKLETTYGSAAVKHHYALALRDSGKVEQALTLFHEYYNSGYKSTTNEAIYKGNCARCYSKLNNYIEAESNIRDSLKLLIEKTSYFQITNIGYAYLWISEIMFDREKYRESKAFIMLVEKVWQEYAPGLIYRINETKNKFMSNIFWNEESLTDSEIKQIESKFIANDK